METDKQLRDLKIQKLQDRSREQKRRIAAGEMLVCTQDNPISGERDAMTGKPVYHKDARPGPDHDILAMTSISVCPHCKTNVTIHRRFWDYEKKDWR